METTNTNTATLSTADQIRAALKAAGYSRKAVTVKHSKHSMGSSVYITIRDISVSKLAIAAICDKFQNVRRDGSGEILSGGNRFVDVSYDGDMMRPVARLVAEQLAACEPNVGTMVQFQRVAVMKSAHDTMWEVCGFDDDGCGNGFRVYAGHRTPTADDLMCAARQLVERRIDADHAARIAKAAA